MEPELIKSNIRLYYDGDLAPGKLLKSSGEKEIQVNKFNAVKIGERYFLLDPKTANEEFLNLQFKNGKYQYLYKSGSRIIVRDENGEEFTPVEWMMAGAKVMTSEGVGIVQTLSENIALVKSESGTLKNHYIKNLQPAEPETDFQKLRKGWALYNEVMPQIQSEIRTDKTNLLRKAMSESGTWKVKGKLPTEAGAEPTEAPAKVEVPKVDVPPVEAPTVEAPKVGATETVKPKAGLLNKIKNIFTKPKGAPAPTPAPEIPQETVNVNHDLAVPAPEPAKVSSPEHLEKNYTHVDKSNQEGQHFHQLTHIDLNPNATSEGNKYLYHYEIGDHRDPIVTDKYLHPSGIAESAKDPAPSWLKSSVYVPGEKVIDKTTGEQHTVVSHLDHDTKTNVLNKNNILVKDKNGETKSVPRMNVQLDSADKTTHSIVNTKNGNKHLHDLKAGDDRDIINHNGQEHHVLFSDPEKGLATVNKETGEMHFTSARDYHKPYLGEVKPVAKEGQTVQIGKTQYKIEHVGGDEKGMSVLSTTGKLGDKEYFEHPTEKLHSKILKQADLQKYEGDTNFKKRSATEPEEDPQNYPHADMTDIEPAEKVFENDSKHPDLTESDHKFLAEQGHSKEDINGMTPEQVQETLSKKPPETKENASNPMPETPAPQSVEDEQKRIKEERNKAKLDQIAEQNDKVFGEHNKTVTKDGITHRVGIGDLAVKTTLGGGTEVINKEVPLGKNKTAIIHDIDPVSKQITFRMKGDDPGDKKKYKTRSIEDFKTHVQENEKLDPITDTDVKAKQTAHENAFQNKVYERTAKHLHEKGLEPTKENIEKELNTSNSGLRQDVEGYHKTYEKNHNKEKSKGSIVDHPEREQLDIEKTLKNIPNIEEKVKGEIEKIKGSREEKRKSIKEDLSKDIANEYHQNGKEYDSKPDEEATKDDFESHRNLGGTDEEIHAAVKEKLSALKGQKTQEENVKKQKADYKQAAQDAEDALKAKENQKSEDYLNEHHRSKPDIASQSINSQLGLKTSEREFDVPDNKEHDKSKFEDHIVPLSSLTASHIPTEAQKNQEAGAEKAPMTPNPAHPSRLQGRQTYHEESDAGTQDRKYTMNVGSDIRPKKLTGEGTEIDTGAPIVENKGMGINNGRIVGMQTATPEAKEKYVAELKKTAKQLFPDANEEELHAKFQELLDKGDMPVHVRVPKHSSGDYLSYDKHPDETSSLASASNNPGIKSSHTQDKIQTALNTLNDETKLKILKQIPPNITLRQHIQDTGNAKKMLQHYNLDPQVQKLFFGKDGRINDDGKDFLTESAKHLNLDKELKELADKNGKLGKKFDDFHNANYETLGDIKSNNKDYDLIPHIKDALRETVADKNQSVGQQKINEESPITKGLRYLINSPEKDGHKKINNFGLDKELNEVANSIAEAHHQASKEFEGNTKIGRQIPDKTTKGATKEDEDEAIANKSAVNKYVKDGGDIVKFNSTVKQKLKELQHYHTHQAEATGALKRYRDATKNVAEDMGADDGFGGLGFEAPKDLSTPQQTKEKFFKKYADLHDRQQTTEANKQSSIKPKEEPESVSVENEKSDKPDDLSNHPEAKKYEKFPDKKTVSLNDVDAFKGIHPDNIMHFNQGGANSRYGRVSFIAPSEHKIKKHEQYKKLAKELREEGKDVLINAFKNPSIVAKVNGMKKSFWDELRKSFEDPEPQKNAEPAIEEIADNYLKNGIKYHGTSNPNVTDKVLPSSQTGVLSEVGRKKNLNKVFYTDSPNSAKIYAGRAKNSYGGTPVVHKVIPMGELTTLNSNPGTEVHHSDYGMILTPELSTKLTEYLSQNKIAKSHNNYTDRIHELRNRQGRNISSIAVMNGDKILMGRRRDSDKWTLPGGHAEEGETAEETGIRELEEETGIKAKKLKPLGSEEVKNPNAPELMINCFRYDTDEATSMRDDPDTEVKKWVWISTPISQEILDNLHAEKNVTLKLLGLQNWEKSFVNQMRTAYNNLIKLLS